MKPLIYKLAPAITLFALSATRTFAQGVVRVGRPNQVTFENLGSLIGAAVGILIIVALIIAFIYLIIGGIKWITSGGDKAQVEEARNQITNALVGVAIVAAAWAVMKLVGFFFGIDPFALEIDPVTEFE